MTEPPITPDPPAAEPQPNEGEGVGAEAAESPLDRVLQFDQGADAWTPAGRPRITRTLLVLACLWQSLLVAVMVGLAVLHVFGVMAALLPAWIYASGHGAIQRRAGEPATTVVTAVSVVLGSVAVLVGS